MTWFSKHKSAPVSGKSIIFQSFRTHDVPEWMTLCMNTVREWASFHGFDYRFVDDEFFNYAPEWFRIKAAEHLNLITDMARLKLASELLAEGYEHAVWVDADVLIMDKEGFQLPKQDPYYFCREMFLLGYNGELKIGKKVTNSICGFRQGNPLLDFLIHAGQEVVNKREGLGHAAIGTELLTGLNQHLPLPQIHDLILTSPLLLWGIDTRNERVLRYFAEQVAVPVRAANLCAYFRNKQFNRLLVTDELFSRVCDALLANKGAVINHYLPADMA